MNFTEIVNTKCDYSIFRILDLRFNILNVLGYGYYLGLEIVSFKWVTLYYMNKAHFYRIMHFKMFKGIEI